MGTFTPPVADGNAWTSNPWGTARGDRLMKHYGAMDSGVTVWQDQDLTWHEDQYPYAGRPDSPGLLQARRVYLGGHVHEIDDVQLVELADAGYFDRINIADVEIPFWKPEHVEKLTHWKISTPGDGAVAKTPFTRNGQLIVQNSAGPAGTSGGQRDVWVHEDILYENFQGEIYMDAPNYAQGVGPDQHLQQIGVVLRHNTTAGEQQMVALNNNVFFEVPVTNIGVWHSTLDGSAMQNRQTSLGFPALLTPSQFPYEMGYWLDGPIVRVRVRKPGTPWPPWTNDRTSNPFSQAVNLDTEASSPAEAAAIPTPVGRGSAGLIHAHLGTVSEGIFGPAIFRNPDNHPGSSF